METIKKAAWSLHQTLLVHDWYVALEIKDQKIIVYTRNQKMMKMNSFKGYKIENSKAEHIDF